MFLKSRFITEMQQLMQVTHKICVEIFLLKALPQTNFFRSISTN